MAGVTPISHDVHACCPHRQVVQWLPAPMWWHHISDLRTCSRMLHERAPSGQLETGPGAAPARPLPNMSAAFSATAAPPATSGKQGG
jgi:hypothetical protein